MTGSHTHFGTAYQSHHLGSGSPRSVSTNYWSVLHNIPEQQRSR